jgi:hypothetical protein
MKIIRIIALEIRKYFKNTDVSPKKITPNLYCHSITKKFI